MGMAAVLLAPWVLRDVRRGVLPRGSTQIGLVMVSGVFLAGHFLLWTASLKYTSIAASVLLVSLHPILVTPLGKRLLGERVSRRMLTGGGLAIIGMLVTCAGDLRVESSAFGGDLLAHRRAGSASPDTCSSDAASAPISASPDTPRSSTRWCASSPP